MYLINKRKGLSRCWLLQVLVPKWNTNQSYSKLQGFEDLSDAKTLKCGLYLYEADKKKGPKGKKNHSPAHQNASWHNPAPQTPLLAAAVYCWCCKIWQKHRQASKSFWTQTLEKYIWGNLWFNVICEHCVDACTIVIKHWQMANKKQFWRSSCLTILTIANLLYNYTTKC